MAAKEDKKGSPSRLAADHVGLARMIAGRLRRSYGWVCLDDLRGYAFLGLSLAARAFRADRGVPFECFAMRKGMFLAIDEMRKDGVVHRRRLRAIPSTGPITGDVCDPNGDLARERIEARDTCRSLLDKLKATDRRLLLMYYADHMTFKQIGAVLDISESAVCLRHKMLIEKLRRLAEVRLLA